MYIHINPNSYTFAPTTMETLGRLGKVAVELINKLASIAAEVGEGEKGAFMASALRIGSWMV